ncbi:hypothetical protein MNBD_GAMMA12-2553 [hydrothermal vent metagenome]|uniref:HIT domain-containing protein n=1 Tax=hydrothermal vent metagenome TaxID=652676 RepID=A0A3B0YZ43_9ZZZZ
MTFVLDTRLQKDCHFMAETNCCQLLLLDNALYHWFILVPKVTETELHDVNDSIQEEILKETMSLSRFVKESFNSDKINVATIGNIVSQLHIHVVGRQFQDSVWPAVVWGAKPTRCYTDEEVKNLHQLMQAWAK